MIVDAHVHIYPDQGGDGLGRSAAEQHAMMQAVVKDFWGRMVTSHTDPRFIPKPGEDVQFSIGDYGRWTWRKHGEDCWLQRGTPSMTRMMHSPEQLVATMDAAGVDYGVIQADIEYIGASHGRENYYRDCITQWGHRLLATIPLNYNLAQSNAALDRELAAISECADAGFRGVYLSGGGLPEPLDDPRCETLWREITRLNLPAYVQTGFCELNRYRDQIRGLLKVLDRHPTLQVIEAHLGGNVVHPSLPGYTNVLDDLRPLLQTGRFFLELGYVLGFENRALWGEAARYPFAKHNEIAKALYDEYGASHLVWGSDVPWCYRVCTYDQGLDLVRSHTPYMTDEDRAAVLGGNMAQLFGLDEANT